MSTRKLVTLLVALALVGHVLAKPVPQDKGDTKAEPKKDADRNDLSIVDLLAGDDEVTLEGKARRLVLKQVIGAAKVDCGKLEVDEIEIGTVAGGATVVLKLPEKTKLKKLLIGTAAGGAVVDCSRLDVAEIEIGTVAGSAKLDLSASGNVTIKSVAGGATVAIARCKDLVIMNVGGGPTIDASYSGEATIPENTGGEITLKKVDAPKK